MNLLRTLALIKEKFICCRENARRFVLLRNYHDYKIKIKSNMF